jgi:hypothetical protein
MGFDRLLPELVPGSRVFGRPWFALPVALALLGVALGAAAAASWVGRLRRGTAVGVGLGAAATALVLGVLAVTAPLPLPEAPLSFTEQDVGGPIRAGGPVTSGPAVPLQGVGAGTFRITADYTLDGGPGSGAILSYCTPGPPGAPAAPRALTSPPLIPGNHTTVMTLRCPTGTLWFQMTAQPATGLAVASVVLAKTASG